MLLGEIDGGGEREQAVSQTRLALAVKNMWELQNFVMALDAIETVGTLTSLAQEYVLSIFHMMSSFLVRTQDADSDNRSGSNKPPNREVFERIAQAIRAAKAGMKPVLKGWLLETTDKENAIEFAHMREAYLPDTIIAYVAALQYAGSCLTRENLLEAMDLAAIIAGKDSDLVDVFLKTDRMKELVEAFASCSKALAVHGADSRKEGRASAKKIKEMGWSKDLWAVKSSS